MIELKYKLIETIHHSRRNDFTLRFTQEDDITFPNGKGIEITEVTLEEFKEYQLGKIYTFKFGVDDERNNGGIKC